MMALVFGGKGWIGSEFVKQLVASRIVTKELPSRGFDGKGYTFKQLDFIIKQAEPDLVINCSGYTGKPNVDACEDHKAEAIMSNVVFVKMLAESCGNLGMPLAHVSSGCIYNGYEKEFTEEDPPNFTFDCPPCSFYSGTKAMAESVLAPLKKKWVWRLRIPFEAIDGPRNYLSKIIGYDILLNMRNSLSHKEDYVKACVEMVLRYKPFGIYNMTNPGSVTTEEVVEMMKMKLDTTKEFKYFPSIEEFNKTVRTPRSNCVLNTDKLTKTGIVMRPVKEALQDTINHWKW
jgi:dTDP-4-dehydrorhamnose reductase